VNTWGIAGLFPVEGANMLRCLVAAVVLMVARGEEPWTDLPEETLAILETSGAMAALGPEGVLSDSTLVAGKCELDFSGFYYGDEERRQKFPVFRMELIILAEDGTKTYDFFRGIEIPGKSAVIVGTGNHTREAPPVRTTALFMEFYKEWAPDTLKFAEDFPELLGKPVPLTLKEFNSAAYYLENVPAGTAYVWFQIAFDGNRITQMPLAVELQPEPGRVTRLDIRVEELFSVFCCLE
jgi:hypothetical protein